MINLKSFFVGKKVSQVVDGFFGVLNHGLGFYSVLIGGFGKMTSKPEVQAVVKTRLVEIATSEEGEEIAKAIINLVEVLKVHGPVVAKKIELLRAELNTLTAAEQAEMQANIRKCEQGITDSVTYMASVFQGPRDN